MTVLALQKRYRELGRLRLGTKASGGKRPVKLETWRLTSPSREILEGAAALYGGEVSPWDDAPTQGDQYQLITTTTEINVYVPDQDIAHGQYYELWSAGGVQRRCDGETELISGRDCLCDPDDRKCQLTTHLIVILPQLADLGTWRLTSHGYNAAAELPTTVALLMRLNAEGALPAAVLGMEQRTQRVDGQTRHFVVPVLRIPYSIAQAEASGIPILTSPVQRASLPAERPRLPADAAFEGERRGGAWGEPPLLPGDEAVEPSRNVPETPEPEGEPDAPSDVETPQQRGEDPSGAPRITDAQRKHLMALAADLEISMARKEIAAADLGLERVTSFSALTKDQAHDLIEIWAERLAEAAGSGEESPADRGPAEDHPEAPSQPDPATPRPSTDPVEASGFHRGKAFSEIAIDAPAYLQAIVSGEIRAPKTKRELAAGWLAWAGEQEATQTSMEGAV